jgi:lipopolysaccharide export system permease protein
MFKKIDKLVFKAFIGRFLLVSGVMLFIFLSQYMIKNFKHFIGKDLGFDVLGELFFYFGLLLVPVTLPISTLLSSLMAFGTLGEHSELTAIKSSGISLLRIIRPVFLFVLVLTFACYSFNEFVVPEVNLKAYSLLYDIKQKKPTLDLQEGIFYNGLEDYSIKAEKKNSDGKTLEGVIIYDHTERRGNVHVITAKSGVMEKVMGDEYLSLVLMDGASFNEVDPEKKPAGSQYEGNKDHLSREQLLKDPNFISSNFVRSKFDTARILFSLESFSLQETKKELFKGHNLMKHQELLLIEMDSIRKTFNDQNKLFINSLDDEFFYTKMKGEQENKISKVQNSAENKYNPDDSLTKYRINLNAYNRVNGTYSQIRSNVLRADNNTKTLATYIVDIFRRYSQPVAVLMMFLVGAPLGAIIKRGGLGMPVLVSIVFFVIFYITTIMGEKWAKELVISPYLGSWASNMILFLIGLVALRQAYFDSRLFEADYYKVLLSKIFRRK